MRPQDALTNLRQAHAAYNACETGDPNDHQRLNGDVDSATDAFNMGTLLTDWPTSAAEEHETRDEQIGRWVANDASGAVPCDAEVA